VNTGMSPHSQDLRWMNTKRCCRSLRRHHLWPARLSVLPAQNKEDHLKQLSRRHRRGETMKSRQLEVAADGDTISRRALQQGRHASLFKEALKAVPHSDCP